MVLKSAWIETAKVNMNNRDSEQRENEDEGRKGKWLCCKMPKSLQTWWSRSFVLDYVGIIVGGILLLLVVSDNLSDKVFPMDEQAAVFSLEDPAIGRPLHYESVPIEHVTLIMIIPSVALYAFFAYTRRNGVEDLHSVVLGLSISLLLGNLITFMIRQHINKPRPDLIMRCAPLCMQNVTWVCAPDESLYDSTCRFGCCPVMCGIKDDR